MKTPHYETVIIGGGPAGLTSAYLLSKASHSVCLYEASDSFGGISRTPTYKNCHFDIGGHRFFSKSSAVMDLWHEILPNMLTRPRSSKIYYRKKYYQYPLNAKEALFNLGIIDSIMCVCSYLYAQIKPRKKAKNFKEWICQRFGNRLYQHFFKTYTEKVWGMRCEDISADWAAQRIKGMSLYSAIKNALIPQRWKKKSNIKSLIQSFLYPPKGPGQLWTECAIKAENMGAHIETETPVCEISYLTDKNVWQVTTINKKHEKHIVTCNHVISSAALRDVMTQMIIPHPNEETIAAASALKYRDFIIVSLILKDKKAFTDNWLYIHDNSVDVGRIQNFKSWSPEMVADDSLTCYGMEYFCNSDGDLWAMRDADLIKKAKQELIELGLAKDEDIIDGVVIRQPLAYPVYDQHYQLHVNKIRKYIYGNCPNLHLVGRNGMHKYNNQDHAMMTAMLTVQNIISGNTTFDVWEVNQDAEYHEHGKKININLAHGLRDTPENYPKPEE